MTGAFLAGMVAGYGVAVPVGAIAVLIAGLTARTSLRVGAAACLGAATADGVYALIAVLGGAALAAAIAPFSTPLRWIAAVVLVLLAAYTARSALRQRTPNPTAPPAADSPTPAAGPPRTAAAPPPPTAGPPPPAAGSQSDAVGSPSPAASRAAGSQSDAVGSPSTAASAAPPPAAGSPPVLAGSHSDAAGPPPPTTPASAAPDAAGPPPPAAGASRPAADPVPAAPTSPPLDSTTPGRAYLGVLGLTLLNPATIVYFAALVLGRGGAGGGVPFVVGAFLASASWQLLIAGGGALVGRVLTGERGRRITALVSSAVIAVLAVGLIT